MGQDLSIRSRSWPERAFPSRSWQLSRYLLNGEEYCPKKVIRAKKTCCVRKEDNGKELQHATHSYEDGPICIPRFHLTTSQPTDSCHEQLANGFYLSIGYQVSISHICSFNCFSPKMTNCRGRMQIGRVGDARDILIFKIYSGHLLAGIGVSIYPTLLLNSLDFCTKCSAIISRLVLRVALNHVVS